MNHEIHESHEKIKKKFCRIFLLKSIFLFFVVKNFYMEVAE